MSRRGRVIFALIAVFLFGLAGFVRHNIEQLEHRYRESAEELLVDTAQLVAAWVAVEARDGRIQTEHMRLALPALRERAFEAQIFDALKQRVNLRLYLTDAAGIVLFDSEGRDEGRDFSDWRDVRLTLAGRYGARTTRDRPDDERSTVMYVAAPVIVDGRIVGVASVGKPTASHAPFVRAARENLIAAGLSAGLAVVLAALLAAVWMVRPFGLVSEYLRLFRTHGRAGLPRFGRSALGLFGAAFDEMRDAVAGRNYVEEYVQSLTHELKSPLSAIRGAAELLTENPPSAQRDRFLANIQTESARIQDLIDRLLELADLEKRRRLARLERLDLRSVVDDAVSPLEATAAARGIRFDVAATGALAVFADPFLLQRALANLLHNAVDFSPDDGLIEIRLTGGRRQHELTIRDHGPGIPDFAEKRVFDRFYSLPRPATGRKSTGLGLSFVREIVELHHGQIELKSHHGGGAIAMVRLPALR